MSGDDEPEIIGPEAADDEAPADAAAADRGAYTRKLNAQEVRERESQHFWRSVFSVPVGRREMWAVLERCGTFETPFAASPTGFPDPVAAWHRAGQHSLGNSLYLSWLRLDPDGVNLMLREHHPQLKKPEKPRKKRGVA